MSRRTDPQMEAEICRIYDETSSCKKTAKITGVGKRCVLAVLRRNGVTLRRGWAGRFEMDDPTRRSIRERYECGESIQSLAVELGTSWDNIHAELVVIGTRIRSQSEVNRRHSLREDAFDAIDPDGAYWIGFLFADGCILQGGQSHSISLALSEKDASHIRKFLAFLGSDQPTRERTSGHGSKMVEVSISSNRLVDALGRYGLTPRKTHTAKVEHLEMDRDFWRGVIDGDGCIHVEKDGCPYLQLVGSEAMVSQFRDFVRIHAPASKANLYRLKRSNVSTFACHKLSAIRVIDVLYRDCKTALDRKKAIADALLSDPANFKDGREQGVAKYNRYTLAMLEDLYREMGSWKAVCDRLDVSVPNLANYRVKLRKAAVAAGDVRDEDFPTRMLRVKLKKSDEVRFGPSDDTVQADPQDDHKIPPGYLF